MGKASRRKKDRKNNPRLQYIDEYEKSLEPPQHNCYPNPRYAVSFALPRFGFTCSCGKQWVPCGHGFIPKDIIEKEDEG